jgi:hypothetical protein
LAVYQLGGDLPPPSFSIMSPIHNSVSDTMPFLLEATVARGWENLVGRFGGPMSFRLLVQPGAAIFFAARAGLRDVRLGKPPILCDLLSDPITRQERHQQVCVDVGAVFIVALVLDSIYQVIVQGGAFALELLITAAVLALVPYVVSRGLVTRISRWGERGPLSEPPPSSAPRRYARRQQERRTTRRGSSHCGDFMQKAGDFPGF